MTDVHPGGIVLRPIFSSAILQHKHGLAYKKFRHSTLDRRGPISVTTWAGFHCKLAQGSLSSLLAHDRMIQVDSRVNRLPRHRRNDGGVGGGRTRDGTDGVVSGRGARILLLAFSLYGNDGGSSDRRGTIQGSSPSPTATHSQT
jgi:hypothetical protein